MPDSATKTDWLYWAIPLALVIGGVIWLIVSGDDAPANFEYPID